MPISTNSNESRFKDALWYAAAGAVVGLGAPAAQAQIVYTDIDPDAEVQDTYADFSVLPIDGQAIDFDGDGDNELIFAEREGTTYPNAYILNGAEADTDEPGDAVTALAANLFPFGGVDYAYWLPLEAGTTISSAAATLAAGTYTLATFTFGGSDPNAWVGVGDKYVGLQFTLEEGTTHYGWIRVEIPEAGLLIVKDYAYNATPDTPIQAGDMGDAVANEDDVAGLGGALSRIETYPNPFAQELQYKLEVAAAQEVEVGVYDVLGRRVATLHEGVLAAGSQHTFTLNGSELPNGLYLIQAKGEHFSETTRVTLAR